MINISFVNVIPIAMNVMKLFNILITVNDLMMH